MRHGLRAIVIILLVLAPVLDLAWNEPMMGGSQEARCLLHATPGVTFEPVVVIPVLASELALSVEPHDCLPFIGPSIFIPPRL